MQKHTHFSAVTAIGIFLVVLILGTGWKLSAYRLAASRRQWMRNASAAMLFQYN